MDSDDDNDDDGRAVDSDVVAHAARDAMLRMFREVSSAEVAKLLRAYDLPELAARVERGELACDAPELVTALETVVERAQGILGHEAEEIERLQRRVGELWGALDAIREHPSASDAVRAIADEALRPPGPRESIH